ncbi:MAG TPA: response regulator transcription factor [Terriglobales bacterium]|jgi:two-component system NarL family response regulator|nr:response regulator transcription factor [Terriglobales bacterium]
MEYLMAANHKLFSSPQMRSRCPAREQVGSTGPRIQEIVQKANSPLTANSTKRQPPGFASVLEIAPSNRPAALLTILVADDHPMVREGLVSLINREPDMRVVAEAGNGREAIEQFVKHFPDVTLLDLRMSVVDGMSALVSICDKEPSARIAIVTSYELEEDIYRALRAGALGYILKDVTPEQLRECIHTVAEGRTWVPPQIGAKLARRVSDHELTHRETQVLNAVAAGKSNKEIGAAFNISEATIKVHMTHILEKLRVTGRTEAINVAVKRGLVHLDLASAA